MRVSYLSLSIRGTPVNGLYPDSAKVSQVAPDLVLRNYLSLLILMNHPSVHFNHLKGFFSHWFGLGIFW